MSAEHVLRSSDTQNDTERKLRMRLEGLTKAVGEMEPGQREFCLAAIDEWLGYMAGLRDQRDALRAEVNEAWQAAQDAGLRADRNSDYVAKLHTQRDALNEELGRVSTEYGELHAERNALKAALEKLTRAAKNVAHWHWGACRVQVGQACTCTDQIVALRQVLDELEEK